MDGSPSVYVKGNTAVDLAFGRGWLSWHPRVGLRLPSWPPSCPFLRIADVGGASALGCYAFEGAGPRALANPA